MEKSTQKYVIVGVAVLLVLGVASIPFLNFNTGQAAVVQLEGAITPTSPTGINAKSSITPSKVRELNSKAKDQGASAIIYEWNSGGGAVVASKEIMRAIASVDMPTVCRIRDIGASGAYMASLACDRIVADSSSLTGSVGVKSSYLEFSGLMEKYGIEYVNITSGKYKEVGSPYMNTTEEEKQILKQKTDKIHEEFLTMVKQDRNLTEAQMEEVETGQLFLGSEAEDLNMVDRLGGRQTAVREAENLTGKNLTTFEVETTPSFSLLSLLTADSWISNFVSNDIPFKAEWR